MLWWLPDCFQISLPGPSYGYFAGGVQTAWTERDRLQCRWRTRSNARSDNTFKGRTPQHELRLPFSSATEENLKVITGGIVTKVLVHPENKRACGVEYV